MNSDDDATRQKNQADQRTFLALTMIVAIAVLLLALVAIVLPHVLGIVLVIGGMLFFCVTHYVVWGWWLPRYLNQENDQPDE